MEISFSNYNINSNHINKHINKTSFKALPTKICGFCHEEDVGVVLGSASYQKHNDLILGLLINLHHYALKGLSLTDGKASELLRAIREGSFQRNINVKIACVNHEKNSDILLKHIRKIYENLFNGSKGLKVKAKNIDQSFGLDTSKLLRGFDIIQIHDNMPVEEVEKFANNFEQATGDIYQAPIPKIIKAIHVPKDGDKYDLKALEANAIEYADSKNVAGLILDSSNLATNQIGGTGLVNDWEVANLIINEIHKKTGKPVGLAGGLCPSNIKDAIKKVKPDFVDGNTGFRYDRQDQALDKKWYPLNPGVCPPKDAVAVNDVLKITADLPSSPYFDKFLRN